MSRFPRQAGNGSGPSRLAPSSSLQGDRLCKVCDSIDFDKYLGGFMRTKALGYWYLIQRSVDCPFCRLIVHCVFQQPEANWPGRKTEIMLCNERSWELSITHLDYDGTRSQNYSNKYVLKSQAKRTKTGLNYRFTVSWDGCYGAEQIQYLANRESEEDRQFFGRVVRPEQVNWALCHKWLDFCQKHHEGSCDQPGAASIRKPENLRLIDVENLRIVPAPTHHEIEYVALTYVWGEQEMGKKVPKTLGKDIRTTTAGDYFIPLPENLPRTIQDSIKVTLALNFRYLWTDALCIIQDDEKDRHSQMSRMDAIYNCATLTIAAGSGRHADHGLQGVSVQRGFPQLSEQVKGLRLACVFPSFDLLNSNVLPWNRRGWTFQEKLLSKRILLFTDYQVYFKCSNALWCEDIAMETDRFSKSIMRRSAPFGWVADRKPRETELDYRHKLVDFLSMGILQVSDPDSSLGFMPNYAAVIQEYSRRMLTYHEDKLPAIDGVLRTLDDSKWSYFAGLPRQNFDIALLWQPQVGHTCSCIRNGEVVAPTWSWARWNLDGGCKWYTGDLRNTKQKKLFKQDDIFSAFFFSTPSSKTSTVWAIVGDKRIPVIRGKDADENIPRATNSLPVAVQRYLHDAGTLMFFRTTRFQFRIGGRISHRSIGNSPEDVVEIYELLDHRDRCAGEIWVSSGQVRGRTKMRDFITISGGTAFIEAAPYIPSKYIPTSSDGDGGSSNDDPKTWEIINVMLVEWHNNVPESHIAFRVAIGKLIKKAWEKVPKENCRVYLA